MEIPNEETMIENAESHMPEMKYILSDTKSEDNMISQEKEVKDAQEQLEILEGEKNE